MLREFLSLLILVSLLAVPQLASSHPGPETTHEKETLTEEDILSGTFHRLEQVSAAPNGWDTKRAKDWWR